MSRYKNCLFKGSVKAQGIQFINSFAILENVTCQKNANTGIDIQGSYDISIISSSLLNNVKAGLKISDGNNVTIKNSTFDDSSKGQGIKISNAFIINLENITCRNNANAGIDIQKGSHDISIIASEWLDNARAGLRLLDSYNVSSRDLNINQTQDGNGNRLHFHIL
jgi:pectate lyase